MKRTELVVSLEAVSPALADNDIIPVLRHFWFTGDKLMAYNDKIAIAVKYQSDFTGTVPNTLLSLLKASRAEDIEFVPGDTGQITVKAASSRFKISTRPPEDFIFKMPKMSKKVPALSGARLVEFIESVDSCMRSLGNDPAVPEMNGINLIPTGDTLDIYATNHATLTHSWVDLDKKAPEIARVILSGEFCKQLISAKARITNQGGQLFLEPDFVYLIAGTFELWGNLIRSEHALIDFKGIMRRNNLEGVPLPSKVHQMIERAVIIADSRLDPAKTKISILNGKMNFVTESDLGQASDFVLLPKHGEAVVMVDPKLLRVGADGADKIAITKNAVVFSSEFSTYMISVSD